MTAATVIVTQRERFGMTAESLDSLYAVTEPPFELVYVDGNSPPPTAAYLERQARERGFELVRRDHYLSPNQARNLGLAQARTPYVAFVDNDVIFTPGWLDALVRCAEETNAAVVAPLICEGLPAHQRIHHAGGTYTPLEMDAFFGAPPTGGRRFVETMLAHGEPMDAWRGRLERGETGFCEFHCALARRSLFEQIGPLDEAMLSSKEHIDFSMAARAAGGKVMFEPASVVTYVFPCRARPLEPSDWPFFMLRWSDAWGRRSLERLHQKWDLAQDPQYFRSKRAVYVLRRTQGVLLPLARRLPWIGRSERLTRVAARCWRPLERLLNRALVASFERGRRRRATGTAAP